MVMGWKSLGSFSFWGKSDWEGETHDLSLYGLRMGLTYRRIGSADRWFLEREKLLDVGIGFVDKSHLDCGDQG
jgi:hypothetical protein